MRQHAYKVQVEWTGNDGEGTKSYRAYRRDHTITAGGKEPIQASSDPAFRGDVSRYNPEELLVASLSACHMLWYLHLCADKGVAVLEYKDDASGEMQEGADGLGKFRRVLLAPRVRIAESALPHAAELAISLHHDAHALCYIARSVNFPVEIAPQLLRN